LTLVVEVSSLEELSPGVDVLKYHKTLSGDISRHQPYIKDNFWEKKGKLLR
jgi:hypothetical protein